MKTTSNELQELSLACHFFSRFLFLAPSQKDWEELAQTQSMDWIFDDATPEENKLFQDFKKSLKSNLDDIAADHAQLFTGPGELKATPWASVYLSDEKQVFGDETIIVREYYDKYQFKSPNPFQEPEDHIGLEFQFIGILLQHLEQAKDDEVRGLIITDIRSFLDEHFFPWAEDCLNKAKTYAKTSFYQSIAALALLLITRLKNIAL
ncbi:MAG: molecular chaperone [Alphaproteobacteria bacterium]